MCRLPAQGALPAGDAGGAPRRVPWVGSGLGAGPCLPRGSPCPECAVSLTLRSSLDCLGVTRSTGNAVSLPL